jgi:hypothetical protein
MTLPSQAAAIVTTVVVASSILQDLENGEEPILLADLPQQSFMPRARGRKGQRRPLHWSVPFRWSASGKNGVKLDALETPSGKVTTRSAVLRFFARLSHADAGAGATVATPAQARREHAAAERQLDAIGI